MSGQVSGQMAERGARDESIKKTTIRFPVRLHRWLRHWDIEHDDIGLERTVVAALTEWARARGYPDDDDDGEDEPAE